MSKRGCFRRPNGARTSPADGPGERAAEHGQRHGHVAVAQAGQHLPQLGLGLRELLDEGRVRLLLLHDRGQERRLAPPVLVQRPARPVEVGLERERLLRLLLQARAALRQGREVGAEARDALVVAAGHRGDEPVAAEDVGGAVDRQAAGAGTTGRPSCRGPGPAPPAPGRSTAMFFSSVRTSRAVASSCAFVLCSTVWISRSSSVRSRTSSSSRSTSPSSDFSWPRSRASSRSSAALRSWTRLSASSWLRAEGEPPDRAMARLTSRTKRSAAATARAGPPPSPQQARAPAASRRGRSPQRLAVQVGAAAAPPAPSGPRARGP